jgi:hypothetical protein
MCSDPVSNGKVSHDSHALGVFSLDVSEQNFEFTHRLIEYGVRFPEEWGFKRSTQTLA